MRAENLCAYCKHFNKGFTCTAFPFGIPMPILKAEIEHVTKYPNDNNIVYEPKTDAPLWAKAKAARLLSF
jgi:hypothetical protein